MEPQPPSLDAVRERIDALDAELLRLVDERAGLAATVARAKQAAGDGDRFALRPAREAMLLNRLVHLPKTHAGAALTVRLWREIISDSLSKQGPFHLSIWGGADPARTLELARMRFGTAPQLRRVQRPEEALAAAKTPGGVAVLALSPDSAWWGRLLAEPRLSAFAALPCLALWGPLSALAVAEVEMEPSGLDETLWVTDATQSADDIENALGRDGVAGRLLAQSGGLKLFLLGGFYQRDDARLARAPGRLTGVIGAVARQFDL